MDSVFEFSQERIGGGRVGGRIGEVGMVGLVGLGSEGKETRGSRARFDDGVELDYGLGKGKSHEKAKGKFCF